MTTPMTLDQIRNEMHTFVASGDLKHHETVLNWCVAVEAAIRERDELRDKNTRMLAGTDRLSKDYALLYAPNADRPAKALWFAITNLEDELSPLSRAQLRSYLRNILAAHSAGAQPVNAKVTHTCIGHNTPDRCCGCWNIDDGTLVATCNECGEKRDVRVFLEAQPSAQPRAAQPPAASVPEDFLLRCAAINPMGDVHNARIRDDAKAMLAAQQPDAGDAGEGR